MPLVNGVDARGRPTYADANNPIPTVPQQQPVGEETPLDTILGTYAPTPPATSIDYSNLATRLSQIRDQGTDATVRTQYAVQRAAELKRQEEAAAKNAADKQSQLNATNAAVAAAQKAAADTKAALAKIQKQYGSGNFGAGGTTTTTSALRQKLVATVASQKGVDYQWGGESPKTGFDCSGLVQWAYAKVGIKMPRVSKDQAKMGVRWPISKLQPGDLVAHPGHIAVYAGNGMMWEAPHTGAQVRLVPVRSDMYGVHLSL